MRERTAVVEFDAGPDHAGTPATWGQQSFLATAGPDQDDAYATALSALAAGAGVPTTLAMIASAVVRLEALRTTLRLGDRGPEQHVHGGGEIHVGVVEASAPTNSAEMRAIAGASGSALLPFTVHILTTSGQPTHVLWAVSHRVVDATSLRQVRSAWSNPSFRPTRQPREQAGLEREGVFDRHCDRAVASWRRVFGEVCPPFRDQVDAAPAPATMMALTSRTAADQMAGIADRCSVPTSAVVLAALAVSVAHLGSEGSVPLQLVTSNRHLAGVGDYVGVLAQWAPLQAIFDPGWTFDQLARDLSRRSTLAYRSALWSPDALDAGLRQHGTSAREVLGATVVLNDVRSRSPQTVVDLPDLRDEQWIEPLTHWPYQNGRCAVAVAEGPDVVQFALCSDSRHLPPAAASSMLSILAGVLRDAAGNVDIPVGRLRERAEAARVAYR